MSFEILLKTLLLGSSNLSELQKDVFAELKEFGIEINEEKLTEEKILDALAAYAILRKAARVLDSFQGELPIAAKSDELELCSDKASALLSQILKMEDERLLKGCLETISLLNQRVPEQYLPTLLDLGIKNLGIRNSLQSIIGKRGEWLAAFEPEWDYAENKILDEDQVFLFGKKKDRINLLKKMRLTEPEKALQLFENCWQEEDFQNRADFVKTLEINLSSSDLIFLEKTAKDGRKEVRTESVKLLSCLEDSSVVNFAKEQLLKFINIAKNPEGLSLSVNLKNKPEDWKEYGILENYKPLPEGEKANLFTQLIAIVPVSFWNSHWEVETKALLETAYMDKFCNMWFWGWAKSAVKFNDSAWITELHRFLFHLSKKEEASKIKFSPDFLFRGLDDDFFNKLALAYIRNENQALSNDNSTTIILLLEEERKWSDELSNELINRLKSIAAKDNSYHSNRRILLKNAAYAVNPLLFEQFENGWPEQMGYAWQKELDNFKAVLQIRREIQTLKNNEILNTSDEK
jgi:hypothetical protein